MLGTGQAEDEVHFFSEDLVFICFSTPWGGGGLAAEVPQVRVCIVTVLKVVWSLCILHLRVT